MKKKSLSKKKVKKIDVVVHVHCSYNNTIVTLTDIQGNTIYWRSAGTLTFKNSKKSTFFAAQTTTRAVINFILQYRLTLTEIKINGYGLGRSASIKTFKKSPLSIQRIRDVSPIAYNGCRLMKKRTV
jgi:small subunit ribosomal protein S11